VDKKFFLKKVLDKFDKGKLSREEVEAEIKRTKHRVVRAQVSAGLDVVTDGMIRWEDEISYLMLKFYGVYPGELSRWFDTNFYYRVPTVERSVWTMPCNLLLKDKIEFPEVDETVKRKLVLTGPYTLAKMSINNAYEKFEDLVYDLAHLIEKEIKHLVAKGFMVQINEPAITKHPEDKEIFLTSMRLLFSNHNEFKINGGIILSTYFGSVEFMLKELIRNINCGGLGLDLVEYPEQIEVLKRLYIDKDLHLGLVNARATKLETYGHFVECLYLFDKIGFKKDIYVCPNNGLEFLPWDKAESKLKNMVECVNRYKEKR